MKAGTFFENKNQYIVSINRAVVDMVVMHLQEGRFHVFAMNEIITQTSMMNTYVNQICVWSLLNNVIHI